MNFVFPLYGREDRREDGDRMVGVVMEYCCRSHLGHRHLSGWYISCDKATHSITATGVKRQTGRYPVDLSEWKKINNKKWLPFQCAKLILLNHKKTWMHFIGYGTATAH